MRTRNTLTHPLLIDAILARDGAWVIEEECTDGSHRPCCLIRFGVDRRITAALMTVPRFWRAGRRLLRRVEAFAHKEDRRDDAYPCQELWSRGFIVAVGACGPPSSGRHSGTFPEGTLTTYVHGCHNESRS